MMSSQSARERYAIVLKDGSDMHHHMPFLREHSHGNVMEIGVRLGASTTALLAGIEDHGGHLWSVDKDDSCKGCFEGHPQWTFIHADSINSAKVKPLLPESLGLLMIDGDHAYEAVLSDLNNYGDRAKMITLHDAEDPRVKTAIRDYCSSHKLHYEIRYHSFGLGVIER